jgi:hypothetical protein
VRYAPNKYLHVLRLCLGAGLPYAEADAIARDVGGLPC